MAARSNGETTWHVRGGNWGTGRSLLCIERRRPHTSIGDRYAESSKEGIEVFRTAENRGRSGVRFVVVGKAGQRHLERTVPPPSLKEESLCDFSAAWGVGSKKKVAGARVFCVSVPDSFTTQADRACPRAPVSRAPSLATDARGERDQQGARPRAALPHARAHDDRDLARSAVRGARAAARARRRARAPRRAERDRVRAQPARVGALPGQSLATRARSRAAATALVTHRKTWRLVQLVACDTRATSHDVAMVKCALLPTPHTRAHAFRSLVRCFERGN